MTLFYVHSLGCCKNLVDSEGLTGYLIRCGNRFTDETDKAGFVILNTCAFIREARDEADHWIRHYLLKKKERKFVFVVLGCLVEFGGVCLPKKYEGVDHFVGINQAAKIKDIIEGKETDRLILGGEQFFWEGYLRKAVHAGLASRYVKISEGCSRKCSFCLIPGFRGRLKSNLSRNILDEARTLVRSGAKEINIVSQDTASYGRDLKNRDNLIKLIRNMAKIDGLEFLRLLYLYPDSVSGDLLAEFKVNPKLCRYLDIPIQHISDKVLKGMKRASRQDRIRSLLEKIRSELPEAAVRTTLMVGFPGEGDREFNRLVDFVREGWFDHLGVFVYSPHPGLKDLKAVGRREALIRRKAVYDVQKRVSREKNRSRIGSVEKVLIEGSNNRYSYGRSQFHAPEIDGCVRIYGRRISSGSMVKVKFVSSKDYDMEGEIA